MMKSLILLSSFALILSAQAEDLKRRVVGQIQCRYEGGTYANQPAYEEVFGIYTVDEVRGSLRRLKRREILAEGYVSCHTLPNDLIEPCKSDAENTGKKERFKQLVKSYEAGYDSAMEMHFEYEPRPSKKACIKEIKRYFSH